MNKKERYKITLLQDYDISDIDQLNAQYRCKIEISIFCTSCPATQINYGLATSTNELHKK